ncbi:hypothetical protein [Bizionia paragorgiae]|uniref:Lipoprotein n=1 Tax=Bizionia paragorgiae TaxID=283786 RepID=A0A1H4BLQ5_BIZPA|nr:hypothetical protein [Bizionia paragorgiae]SEA49070.1 hypothetical protein SAMN04487990_11532 [Bizionia paragorgiae]
MKNLLLAFAMLLIVSNCNKNDDDQPTNPIDQLPPATQTGANTFGCLLDGEPFLPGISQNPLDCVYQFVNGGYYFSLQANKRNSENNLIRLGIGTENLEINQGNTYNLSANIDGNASGIYFFNTFLNYTSQDYTGELTITKLDFTNNIVSGTFWYDIEDYNGVVHQIREGRFDMQFTQ